jgi:ATP-binding cassette, subfamily B, multidrug efflux pump
MKKVLAYLAPYRAGTVLALIFVLLQSLSELALPSLMAEIVDKGIAGGDSALIGRVGAQMLIVAIAGAFAAVAGTYYAASASAAFGRDLRAAVFQRTVSWSPAEFEALGSATLLTRTTSDVTQVQNFAMMTMRMLARAPLMALGGIVFAVIKNPFLSLVLLASLPLLSLTVALIAHKGMPMFKSMQAKLDGLNRVLRESLTGIRVVRAFDRGDMERERFSVANEDLVNVSLAATRFMALMGPAMMIVMNATSLAIVGIGGFMSTRGGLPIGDLMAFLQYATQILFSMMMLSMMFVMYPRASVSAERIAEVLSRVSAVMDRNETDAAGPGVTDLGGALRSPSAAAPHSVEFRDVSFRYPGAEEYALRGVSFKAEPGEMTAIIGGTGSGKSTLLALLERFYDADEGAVLVDGMDVREWPIDELRKRIGYAPQKAVLFSGTVAENLRYGDGNASDAEVRAALVTAQAADFVEALPEGSDSRLAQGGANLSGGQKQRLAIARALVRKPPIYAFDDSFSALDFKTDARLRAAFSVSSEGATRIVVAQRVGTVMGAERIVVLDEGRVVGIGRHAELVASCEAYREIVESQLEAEAVR